MSTFAIIVICVTVLIVVHKIVDSFPIHISEGRTTLSKDDIERTLKSRMDTIIRVSHERDCHLKHIERLEKKCQNHRLENHRLKQALYRAKGEVTK